jgi:hypothetical protein
LDKPDKADFDRCNDKLADAAPDELAKLIRAVKASAEFRQLGEYRNLAAHRGMIGEQVRGAEGPDGQDEVKVLLPAWLPEEFPDYPEAYVAPILHRYVDWAVQVLPLLASTARRSWPNVEEERSESEAKEVRFEGSSVEVSVSSADYVVTPETLAPRMGEWKVWFSHGSHDFNSGTTDPPAWFLRRSEDPNLRLDAAGISPDDLHGWITGAAGGDVAKSAMRHYRPRFLHGTEWGSLLIPGSG